MKIVKLANKKVLKISQKEWESIGLNAGWLENNEEIKTSSEKSEAPVKEPEVKPTVKPDKEPKIKPNRFPKEKPKAKPNPRAEEETSEEEPPEYEWQKAASIQLPSVGSELERLKKKLQINKIANNYGDVNANIRLFWQSIPENHRFFHNNFLKTNGFNLSEKNFAYINEMQRKRNIPSIPLQSAESEAIKTLKRIQQIEQNHQNELLILAKRVISEQWNIPEHMIDVSFMQKFGGPSSGMKQHQKKVEITPEIQEQINKRISLNCLTDGAALHSLLTVHHLAEEEINKISSELLSLYDKFAICISLYNFANPQWSTGDLITSQGAGWSGVDWQQDENGDASPVVKAEGMSFSVICQEIVKGIMQLATSNGIIDSSLKGSREFTEEEWETIIEQADQLQDEYGFIMTGPELWRRFLEARPEDTDLFDLVSEISKHPPENVDDMLSMTAEDPEEAKGILEVYAGEIPNFNEEEEDDTVVEEDSEEDEDWWKKEDKQNPPKNPPQNMFGNEFDVVDVDESEYDF